MKIMKKITDLLIVLAIGLLMAACTHEPALVDIQIEALNSDVKAGETVTFNITGEYEFLSFYSGLKGKEWDNYPEDQGVYVDLPADETTYEVLYNDTDGVVISKFIVTSFGDWGTEEITKVIEIPIDVDDNRTQIQSVRIKYYEGSKRQNGKGSIDNDNGTVSFDVGADADLSAVNVNISAVSSKAKVLFNGKEIDGPVDVDFSSGNPKFSILATNGETTQDFTFIFNRI